MVMKADVSALFGLAKAFGPEGQKAALDIAAASVTAGAKAAKVSLRDCLRSKWTNSTIADKVRDRVTTTSKGIIGIVSVVHDWVEVLVLGMNVPPHVIRPRTAKNLVLRSEKGTPGKSGHVPKIDPRTGAAPIRPSANHPGYQGKDCATPALRKGERVLVRGISRGVLKLAQLLARRGSK